MNHINVVMEPSIVKQLDDLSVKTGKNRSQLIRDAVMKTYRIKDEGENHE